MKCILFQVLQSLRMYGSVFLFGVSDKSKRKVVMILSYKETITCHTLLDENIHGIYFSDLAQIGQIQF